MSDVVPALDDVADELDGRVVRLGVPLKPRSADDQSEAGRSRTGCTASA